MGKKPSRSLRLVHPVVRAVVSHVSRELGVPVEHMRHSNVRYGMMSAARHIIWYVLHDTGFSTYSRLGFMFDADHASVMYGIRMIANTVRTPNALYGKGRVYTPDRKKLIVRVATETRALATELIENAEIRSRLNRDVLVIPVCRIKLSELENLAMADLSTRFSGGWLVELAEFDRNPAKYPLLVRLALDQEKESEFIWVIPTSSASQDASTIVVPSKDTTDKSPRSTTVETATDPTTSPETPKQPSDSPTSLLQTQNA